jgi:hypothetical protein
MKNRTYCELSWIERNPSVLLPTWLKEENPYRVGRKHRLLFPSQAFYYGRAVA